MGATQFRQVYIGILEKISTGTKLRIERSRDEAAYWACSELVSEGYVEGEGMPESFELWRIKPKGRLFLLQLKREVREDSWGGWLWAKGSVIFGFILGASADLFKDVWVYAAHHLFPGIFPAP